MYIVEAHVCINVVFVKIHIDMYIYYIRITLHSIEKTTRTKDYFMCQFMSFSGFGVYLVPFRRLHVEQHLAVSCALHVLRKRATSVPGSWNIVWVCYGSNPGNPWCWWLCAPNCCASQWCSLLLQARVGKTARKISSAFHGTRRFDYASKSPRQDPKNPNAKICVLSPLG